MKRYEIYEIDRSFLTNVIIRKELVYASNDHEAAINELKTLNITNEKWFRKYAMVVRQLGEVCSVHQFYLN
ncbi:MAG: hypothetical protein WC319_14970 [Candidatus Paceibacterota bacterium]|jgi:hypothetical protein